MRLVTRSCALSCKVIMTHQVAEALHEHLDLFMIRARIRKLARDYWPDKVAINKVSQQLQSAWNPAHLRRASNALFLHPLRSWRKRILKDNKGSVQ